jgi:hypothetical protein
MYSEKMKKIMSTVIFCISFLLVISGCLNNGKPAVSFDGTRYKFGQVLEGREIVFTFMFTNTGKKNLVIKDLEVSCFCVKVKEYDRIIRPGEKGRIYGVVTTEGFEGEVVKMIKVTTNVPDSEPVVLTMEGKIVSRPD